MEKITQLYLIRHSKQLQIENKLDENDQINNEKTILSIEGEEKAKQMSEIPELQNIDVLWSSNYVRAISTAKYIAQNNNITINIDVNLGERKLGNLEKLKQLGKDKTNSFTTEQMLDEKLKNEDGENREEVTKRMEKSIKNILENNIGKKIAIVSHGASIKFLLMKWCNLNENNKLEFKLQSIIIDSPSIIKLKFKDSQMIELQQIL